ncbi:uncharacterized protein [Glycine max]|uniref:uncharacterized protein isoform X1 n=1 Tax=Glycine max TaxID=3847 RepID=UPI001B355B03|nr:uncharacterized protein LOC100781125 isoform X1 [Glycine max]
MATAEVKKILFIDTSYDQRWQSQHSLCLIDAFHIILICIRNLPGSSLNLSPLVSTQCIYHFHFTFHNLLGPLPKLLAAQTDKQIYIKLSLSINKWILLNKSGVVQKDVAVVNLVGLCILPLPCRKMLLDAAMKMMDIMTTSMLRTGERSKGPKWMKKKAMIQWLRTLPPVRFIITMPMLTAKVVTAPQPLRKINKIMEASVLLRRMQTNRRRNVLTAEVKNDEIVHCI